MKGLVGEGVCFDGWGILRGLEERLEWGEVTGRDLRWLFPSFPKILEGPQQSDVPPLPAPVSPSRFQKSPLFRGRYLDGASSAWMHLASSHIQSSEPIHRMVSA